MTPTQEQALSLALQQWDSGYVHPLRTDTKLIEAMFLAGYALGAQERQAQDAPTFCTYCHHRIEHTPTEPA